MNTLAAPLLEHLALVAVSMGIATTLGLPLGVAIAGRRRARGIVLGLAGVGQTIPSLALLAFLIPIPWIGGIGVRSAVVALVVYALLPILSNTVTGIAGVDPAVCEAAEAMGMTPGQILWRVKIPLAARTIVTGLRIATVTTVGTATIAAAIGAGGLGVFIFRGLATVDSTQILMGAVPAAALALAADRILAWIESRFVV